MKIQIRQGVYETNSSSVHTMTMCTDSDWNAWQEGKLIFDYYNDELVPIPEDLNEDNNDGQYFTYSDFESGYIDECLETFHGSFNGIHAFGLYGYDG